MSSIPCYITLLGTATVLLEIGSLKILTDPALDPAGEYYSFGFGLGSTKTLSPIFAPEILNNTEIVLLSHDHHDDNLDKAGRAFLPKVKRVLTTTSGANRLGNNAEGLKPWQSTEVALENGKKLKITATPARHGPPLSLPLVGQVIGFILEWEGQNNGALYISGDTVWFSGIAEVAKRFKVGTALLHLGGVGFTLSGPLRYTFNGKEAVQTTQVLGAKTVIPIHYEGWTHFREPKKEAQQAFAQAGLSERVKWLTLGTRHKLEV